MKIGYSKRFEKSVRKFSDSKVDYFADVIHHQLRFVSVTYLIFIVIENNTVPQPVTNTRPFMICPVYVG